MRTLSQKIQRPQEPGAAQPSPYRGEAVCLRVLREAVRPETRLRHPPPHTHRRETVQVWILWYGVCRPPVQVRAREEEAFEERRVCLSHMQQRICHQSWEKDSSEEESRNPWRCYEAVPFGRKYFSCHNFCSVAAIVCTHRTFFSRLE